MNKVHLSALTLCPLQQRALALALWTFFQKVFKYLIYDYSNKTLHFCHCRVGFEAHRLPTLIF